MAVLQHIWHSMFGITYERHGCTCLVSSLTTVERLVGKIVLHRVDEHSIHITAFLLFKLVPCHNIPIAYQSENLLVALDFHEKSGRGYVTTTDKHAIRRQFLEYMRLTCSLWTQFHEIEVVLNMREKTSQSDELLTAVHCRRVQTHCVHQKVNPLLCSEVFTLVDIFLQVDI